MRECPYVCVSNLQLKQLSTEIISQRYEAIMEEIIPQIPPKWQLCPTSELGCFCLMIFKVCAVSVIDSGSKNQLCKHPRWVRSRWLRRDRYEAEIPWVIFILLGKKKKKKARPLSREIKRNNRSLTKAWEKRPSLGQMTAPPTSLFVSCDGNLGSPLLAKPRHPGLLYPLAARPTSFPPPPTPALKSQWQPGSKEREKERNEALRQISQERPASRPFARPSQARPCATDAASVHSPGMLGSAFWCPSGYPSPCSGSTFWGSARAEPLPGDQEEAERERDPGEAPSGDNNRGAGDLYSDSRQ